VTSQLPVSVACVACVVCFGERHTLTVLCLHTEWRCASYPNIRISLSMRVVSSLGLKTLTATSRPL
jgi:hypothetical protein